MSAWEDDAGMAGEALAERDQEWIELIRAALMAKDRKRAFELCSEWRREIEGEL